MEKTIISIRITSGLLITALCNSVGQSVVSNSLRPHGLAHQAPLSVAFSRQESWSGCRALLHQAPLPTEFSRHGHWSGCRALLHALAAAAAAKSCQSCPTLCDPIDSSPPGSPVPGILQARTLEWVAISFSSA